MSLPPALEAVPDPSRYIARVSLRSRKDIEGPIDPSELLVHAHRDKNPIDVAAQFIASRLIELTGKEDAVNRGLRQMNLLGLRLAEAVESATGHKALADRAKRMMGVTDPDVFFQFRETTHLSEREVRARIDRLRADARKKLRARGRSPRLQVLLTGATGFLGKEILSQIASDRRIAQVVAVLRPETIRDPKTREPIRVLAPEVRGKLVLARLGIAGARARKFRFVGGDIEKPMLGIAPRDLAKLRRSLTHVIHCAASVSFDDTYENSYRANVLGSRNALELSLSLQARKGSPFVEHVAIETSYIHGRKKRSIAQESLLVFPRNFYNNFYELTKAMASIETDRFMIERGLRVAQLLPSIVIGHSRTGNNRGDTKVVNAPVNAFGRSKMAVRTHGGLLSRSRARLIAAVALSFPGNRSAEINLVPVDRVVQGILSALVVPEAIGERIHLATDDRIRSKDIVKIVRDEIGIAVRLADPTLFRTVTLPIVKATLQKMKEPRLATALDKLGTIFGGYGEWGQPIHDVGKDVRILKLSIDRPSTEHAFRMLCRHNEYVQEFGRVRDADEVARRELLWDKAIHAIEHRTGRAAGSIPPDEFRKLVGREIDLKTFTAKARKSA